MKRVIDFSKYSSIKIGPKIEVDVIEDEKIGDIFLVGGANNLLISPNPPKLAILSKKFDYIEILKDYIEIGGATKSGRIISFAKKNNIAGFEFLGKLPGTLGGLIQMNAGVKEYEIFNILEEVFIDNRWYKKSEIKYGYRYTDIKGVIKRARFKISFGFDNELLEKLNNLRKNQPKEPSAGSFFKNPQGEFAGKLIESVGLKGKRVGNMAWSNIHANFLINLGGGKFSEAMELINLAKDKVLERYGILLEEEVKILKQD